MGLVVPSALEAYLSASQNRHLYFLIVMRIFITNAIVAITNMLTSTTIDQEMIIKTLKKCLSALFYSTENCNSLKACKVFAKGWGISG